MRKRGFEIVSKYENINIPKRGSLASAGYDFYLLEDVKIKAKGEAKIKTGIKAYMLNDELLEIHIRSSLGIKGLRIKNTVGIIDSDYYNNPKNEGEIIAFLENFSDEDILLEKGDRFIQGIFKKYLTIDSEEELGKRVGGFGSTNKGEK